MLIKRNLLIVGVIVIFISLLALLPLYQRNNNSRGNNNSSPQSTTNSATLFKPDSKMQAHISENYGKLPLSFEANQGQVDDQVKFYSRGSGYNLFLTADEAVLSLRKSSGKAKTKFDSLKDKFADKEKPEAVEAAVVCMKLVDANAHARVVGQDELPGKSNYFIGNDPKQWRTDVANYKNVKYQDVYAGIDMIYYGNQRQLEYDLIVNPGSDPSKIKLHFEGAQKISINKQGDLVMDVDGGEVYKRKPIVYQSIDGIKQMVAGNYQIDGDEVSFQVGDYDNSKPLVIDPVLIYSTYLGGSGQEQGHDIAVDASGNAYVTGATQSIDFPTTNPFQGAKAGGYDSFITKLNATGDAIIYSTYLGGSNNDYGFSIAVDASGNAYVLGATQSTDFPALNPIQAANGGGYDVFITKLNAAGNSLGYSTYYGGNGNDGVGENEGLAGAIFVDSNGNAYITGPTASSNLPTINPIQSTYVDGGSCAPDRCPDAYVAKINAAGSALVYSTYLGGGNQDLGMAIVVDSSGNAYVAGTAGGGFPVTAGAFQTSCNGDSDAFIAKLNPSGNTLIFSTFIGGSGISGAGQDWGTGIAIDSSGNIYLSGTTFSTSFPVANALQPSCNDCGDGNGFVAKFNSTGSSLIYSTFLGGNGGNLIDDIAVNSLGEVYVTGATAAGDFPKVNPIQVNDGGDYDAFVTKLNAAGSAITFSTHLGGNGRENYVSPGRIALDPSNNIYVYGTTQSTNFPTVNPLFATLNGTEDAFITKISESAILQFSSSSYSVSESGGSATITVTRAGDTSSAVSVDYATSDGTATAGLDYTATSGTLNFAIGETSKTFNVAIINDTLIEGDETRALPHF